MSGLSQLNSVIFKDKASASAGKKFFSLFPGLGYAAGYKVRLSPTAHDFGLVSTHQSLLTSCLRTFRFSRGYTSMAASPWPGTT